MLSIVNMGFSLKYFVFDEFLSDEVDARFSTLNCQQP